MGPHLDNTRNSVEKIVEASQKKYNNNIRVGYVGYRDFKTNERFVEQQFTSDTKQVISEMKKLSVQNVGTNTDIPEDVHGGIEVTKNFLLHQIAGLLNCLFSTM